MTLHVDLTPADWTAFLRYIHRRIWRGSKTGLNVLLNLLYAAAVGGLLGGGLTLLPGGPHFPSLLAGAIGIYLYLLLVSRRHARQMAPVADGHVLGPREVILSDEGIREVAARREGVIRWSSILGVDVTPTHVFLRVDTTAAIIIPQRAFASTAARDQFIAKVRARSGK